MMNCEQTDCHEVLYRTRYIEVSNPVKQDGQHKEHYGKSIFIAAASDREIERNAGWQGCEEGGGGWIKALEPQISALQQAQEILCIAARIF